MKSFLKKYLIAGTVVLVPVVATIWVLKVLIVWLDNVVLSLLPRQIQPEALMGYSIPGLGFTLTVFLVLLTGVFTRLYIGKKFVNLGDTFLSKLPFARAIYQAFKQVINTAFAGKGQKQKRVVLVEYPKEDSYAIGFLTGGQSERISIGNDKKTVMVFVPTTPNPTSGFLLIVPEDKVIHTDLTTEEATKLVISGGLLAKQSDLA